MSSASWTERERTEVNALVEVMYLVAQADGEFSIPERRQFLDTVTSISDGKIESTELLSMIEDAERSLAESGLEKRVESLSLVLSDELTRRLAYGLGTKVAIADGALNPSEERVLSAIAGAFGITEEDHEEIAHSVRMSQRPGI